MKKFFRSLGATITVLLIIASLMPVRSFAAEEIDPEQSGELRIHYAEEGKALPDAQFSIYRIADIDKYSRITINETFAPYIKDNLNSYGQDDWAALASTLKGYVARDKITVSMTGSTDSNGELTLPAQTGLYLVIGSKVTTDDHYTYTATPFIVQLPGMNIDLNMWDYSVDVYPKFSKDNLPPDDEKFITRKVLKIWDDEGYETFRPESVTVQLLCDGRVYEEVALNEGNKWRFTWDTLSPDHEWLVVEKEQDPYTATIMLHGITFTITNKYTIHAAVDDPLVQKRIIGDKPKNTASFKFVLTAEDDSYPMPSGSKDSSKEITIKGAGSKAFGKISFKQPGEYVYTVTEKNNGISGYTYDKTVYTITYIVEQKDEALSVNRIISDGTSEVSVIEFTNKYKKPKEDLPHTGQLWWPIPMLLVAGAAMVFGGLILRRKNEK